MGETPTRYGYILAQTLANLIAIFHPDPENPRRMKGAMAKITTTDDVPVVDRPRRYSELQKAFMTAKFRIMKRRGQVEEAKGAYASALMLVPYQARIDAFFKVHGEDAYEAMKDPKHEMEVATFYRVTVDMRRVNDKTVPDVFPLPRIDDLLDRVQNGVRHFSIFDAADAFWTVELDPKDRPKTGFRTHDAHYQSCVLPQGGKCSANAWARMIAWTFAEMALDDILVYQDDVMVYSGDFTGHMRTLQKVYNCMREKDLTFKVTKMKMDYPEVIFLGHMLDGKGRYPSPKSVEAITELAYPDKDQTAVRSFIGMTLYYRQYIENYSEKVAPLHALTKKGVIVPKAWDKSHETAVDELKEALVSQPCLQMVDNTKPFEVRVDACRRGRGCGAILLQPGEDGGMHPVCYWSKTLNKYEREYAATEVEAMALHDAILYWDVYLKGVYGFKVYTDHNALTYMYCAQTASNNGRIMRWLMDLQGYNFELYYKEGKVHYDADAVSRLLRKGEEPEFLTADDLEWDKGIPDEMMKQVARDMEAKARRRIARIAQTKRDKEEKKLKKDGEEVETKSMAIMGCEPEGDLTSAQRRRVRRKIERVLRKKDHTVHLDPMTGMLERDDIEVQRCRLRRRAIRVAHKRKVKLHPDVYGVSDRVLRTRLPKVNPNRNVPRRDDWMEWGVPEDLGPLVKQNVCGTSRVIVGESTIEGANRGLFAKKELREGSIVCDYFGKKVAKEEVEREDYNGEYVFEARMKGGVKYVDAIDLCSCWGRFINDPLDDTLVNAKVIVKGKRLIVVATTEILPGDEIFISYGPAYWMDRLDKLPAKVRAEVEQEYDRLVRAEQKRQGVKVNKQSLTKSKQLPSNPVAVSEHVGESDQLSAKRVRSAVEQMEDLELEKYAFDNVIQSEELAEQLQYLVGRKFIDDENGKLYVIDRIWYLDTAKAVVGTRRPLSGNQRAYDDDCFYVYGAMGLLQLSELYDVGNEEGEPVKWPQSGVEWELAQRGDQYLRGLLEECDPGGEVESSGGEVFRRIVLDEEGATAMHRKHSTNGRVLWQRMVPVVLRSKCLQIFHEGMAHTGSTRMLSTMKLHYYWDGMRTEAVDHCRECRSCKLRQIYYCQPKVPVQEYPEVQAAMERLHMDITGRLTRTEDGNEYILVVKDFQSKYVWIFPIPDKRAETIAGILVKHIFKPFGPPKVLISDRGTEFRNKIVNEVAKQYRVKRICTTRFNPRSNGFVENHNATMKNQLYHYANAKHTDWDVYLHTVEQAYNTTVSAATGYTPFYAMFGREMQTSDVVGLEDDLVGVSGESVDEDGRTWVDVLCARLDMAWTKITERAHENHVRKNRMGKGISDFNEESGRVRKNLRSHPYREYAPGDQFYRKRNPLREFKSETDKAKYKIARKLQARFEGPYVVTERLSPVLYEAEVNGRRVIVHAINMKPDGRPSGPVQVSDRGEMRYSANSSGAKTVSNLVSGRIRGREHIGDHASVVLADDEEVT